MNVTTNVFLDTRRIKKKTNTYPVKLRVTCNRKHQEYQTVFDLTSEDYNKLSASRVSDWLRDVRDKLKEIETASIKVAKG